MSQQHGESRPVIRVLVVDDDVDLTDVLIIGLQRQGFQAVGFNDSSQALAAAGEDPKAFDVVVSDELMPLLRGHELIQRLRSIKPSIKSILYTGDADTNLEALARRSGVDLLLRKSVGVMEVGAAIRSLVS